MKLTGVLKNKMTKVNFLLLIGTIVSLEIWAKPLDIMEINLRYESLKPSQKETYQKVANNLRCPTCTALSIQQSEAPFSLQMRSALLEQIESHKTESEIYKFFTERYGLWILRKPPTEGFHFLAWLLPISVFLLGGGFVWFHFWRSGQSSSAPKKDSDSYKKQLEEDLEKFSYTQPSK